MSESKRKNNRPHSVFRRCGARELKGGHRQLGADGRSVTFSAASEFKLESVTLARLAALGI